MMRVGTVKGAGQRGYCLAVSKIRSAIPVGAVVMIDGTIGINRLTKQPNRDPRQFVVTHAAAPGDVLLNIYPPLEPDGAYQTIAQSPRNRARVLMVTFDPTPNVIWIP